MRSLVWFRRDLRIQDNRALSQAAEESDGGVVALYIITPGQWKDHDDAAAKVDFWLRNLKSLAASLAELRIPLRIATCDSYEQVPETTISVARDFECQSIYFNREYEVNERERDDRVEACCREAGIQTTSLDDRIVVPPCDIETQDGRFYSVFTPYRRVWEKKAVDYLDTCQPPGKQPDLGISSSAIPESIDEFDFSSGREDLWPAGEDEAHHRLEGFMDRIERYHEARDIPAVSGTSLLSPYLAAGVISPRQCLAAAMANNNGQIDGDDGPAIWISELAWRDFYTHVLVGFPRVSMHRPFKSKTDRVPWRTDKGDFEAWKQGRTGYPIVDAGMRQLNQTGWMHNRLRMVTAMFLTKNLLIDWRWGERYFMQQLIDGDLAANNGGWQWSASTGTDAVPYFRIFNPFSQSKRFDSDGKFIQKMCPELSPIPPAALHDEKKLAAAVGKHDVDYPSYVVDYKQGRERALQAFKDLD